jgi:uncharacterized membrane protein YdcZ (DUF606 family)
MTIKRILGIVLVAAGVLVLVARGFSYTKESHKARVGPFDLAVKEKKRVEIPVWTGVVAVAAGTALLLFQSKRER